MKRFYFLVLLLSFSYISFGQNSSLLWEISGKDLSQSSYLFGTMHAMPNAQFFIPKGVTESFQKCSKLILEVKMDDPAIQPSLLKAMIMKDSTIDQLLTAEEFKKADLFFKDSLGFSLHLMNKMKPLFLSSLTIPKLAGKSFSSFENTFMEMAKKYHIEIAGLESVDEAMAQVDKISLSDQAKMIMDFVNDFDKSKREFQELLHCYLEQDVNKLYQLMIKDDDEFKLFGNSLLKERNLLWLSRIENYVKEGCCFIAVGGGHLGGDDGLLKLLERDGYSVKPIQ
jgi:uncharacterized protein YbaP (TraB family)